MRRIALASLIFVSSLATAGCKDKPSAPAATEAPTQASPTAPAEKPVAVGPAEITPASLRLEPKALTEMGLSAAFIADKPFKINTLGQAQSAQQQVGPVFISVWKGPTSTIENWRRGFINRTGSELGEATEIQLCGRTAVKQSAVVPGVPGGGKTMKSIPLADGTTVAEAVAAESPQPNTGRPVKPGRGAPSRTIVMAAVPLEVGGATFGWSIHTDKREAFKAVEDQFFASIKCE